MTPSSKEEKPKKRSVVQAKGGLKAGKKKADKDLVDDLISALEEDED
jgi:hypothetical protein